MTGLGEIPARRRERYAGALVVLFGLVAVAEAGGLQIGSLRQIGPGFFPLVLGILLILFGTAIAFSDGGGAALGSHAPPGRPDWRGMAGIMAGGIAFLGLADSGGLVPATFACVFLAALGDRSMTPARSAVLAAVVTLFGVVVFAYGLRVQLPLLPPFLSGSAS